MNYLSRLGIREAQQAISKDHLYEFDEAQFKKVQQIEKVN